MTDTTREIIEIVQWLKCNGTPYRAIARELGITAAAVGRWINPSIRTVRLPVLYLHILRKVKKKKENM